jgi:hypothetical protein
VFDEGLTRTTELTHTVSTLRRFRNCLQTTMQAWENFERREVGLFDPEGWETLRPKWNGYLSATRSQFDELRTFRSLLEQKLELFNNMRDGVSETHPCCSSGSVRLTGDEIQIVNASALKESAVATRQGEYITLLTRMTVVCSGEGSWRIKLTDCSFISLLVCRLYVQLPGSTALTRVTPADLAY